MSRPVSLLLRSPNLRPGTEEYYEYWNQFEPEFPETEDGEGDFLRPGREPGGVGPAPPKLTKFRQKMLASHGQPGLAVERDRHGEYGAPRPQLTNPRLSPRQLLRGRPHPRTPKTEHGSPLASPKTRHLPGERRHKSVK